MFTALGTPKGALLGLSAAALILAVTYSISAAPVRWVDVVRLAPQSPKSLPALPAAPALPDTVVQVASVDLDDVATGAITTTPEPGLPQAMPAPVDASADFVSALALIKDKNYVDAYAAARGLANDVERRTIQWAAIYYGGGAIAPDTVKAFEDDAPGFISPGVFKTRLEQALIKSQADSADIIKYLGGAMPNTIDAQIKLAAAYVADGQTKRGTGIARQIWVEQFLDKATEDRMLKNFGSLFTADDHWARAMHLMMHDRATATERLYKFMTPAQKSLAVARNAVSRNAKNAKALLDAVDASMKTNPIYNFSRAQRARQFELWDDAIAYLNKGKAGDPDSAEWWYERQTLTRQLLSLGDPKRAYQAAAGYTDGPEGRVVEARFHSGWIALSFLDDAATAATHFAKMTEFATLPDSVTQANYWLGRALSKAGKADAAKAAFEVAAGYPTVYYGLLARQELGLKPVELRTMPQWQDSEAAFNDNELVKAINLLVANGENDKAGTLLRTLADQLETGGELVLAARLAQTIDAHHLAIAIADIADKKGMPLDLFSFPKDGIPATKVAAVDAAAIYAVARQESRFQVNAISSAGARGLMQLMPGTAKETAGKLGLSYSASKLTSDPLYNTKLGAFYLDKQLETYDGSLLLAAAAYNAGPGNANKWIKAFGDPRSSKVDPVVWVELIPFQETRTYVKRVFGNYMVYRARLGHEDLDLAKVMHSING
jgi:soluble lytic murein transglycosylase